MRATRLVAAITLSAMLMALLTSLSLAADSSDMILRDESPPNYQAYGWTFLGLSLISLGLGTTSYQRSRGALDDAETNYQLYQNAVTTSDALRFRAKTQEHLDKARREEDRTNLAILLTVMFGLTSYFSFDPVDESLLNVSWLGDRALVQWRF